MMIGYDIYDRFTMEHFPFCQSMILTTRFFLLATVYYATRFINGTLDTSFMLGTSGAQWSECLTNECLEKL
jgi:hypothetical protein